MPESDSTTPIDPRVGRTWGSLDEGEQVGLPVGTAINFPPGDSRDGGRVKVMPGTWADPDGGVVRNGGIHPARVIESIPPAISEGAGHALARACAIPRMFHDPIATEEAAALVAELAGEIPSELLDTPEVQGGGDCDGLSPSETEGLTIDLWRRGRLLSAVALDIVPADCDDSESPTDSAGGGATRNTAAEQLLIAHRELDDARAALTLADLALRHTPMRAWRDGGSVRAKAIDAVRAVLFPAKPDPTPTPAPDGVDERVGEIEKRLREAGFGSLVVHKEDLDSGAIDWCVSEPGGDKDGTTARIVNIDAENVKRAKAKALMLAHAPTYLRWALDTIAILRGDK